MSATAFVTRDEFEGLKKEVEYNHKSMDYLVDIHRQTEQLCQAFSGFRREAEKRFDRLEQDVQLIKMDMLRTANDVHDLKKQLQKVDEDNQSIKETLAQILEKLP